jgi:hypothetical protein
LYVLEQDHIDHLSKQQPDRKLDRRLLERVVLPNLALELLLAPPRHRRPLLGVEPTLSENEPDNIALGGLLAEDVAEADVVGESEDGKENEEDDARVAEGEEEEEETRRRKGG